MEQILYQGTRTLNEAVFHESFSENTYQCIKIKHSTIPFDAEFLNIIYYIHFSNINTAFRIFNVYKINLRQLMFLCLQDVDHPACGIKFANFIALNVFHTYYASSSNELEVKNEIADIREELRRNKFNIERMKPPRQMYRHTHSYIQKCFL